MLYKDTTIAVVGKSQVPYACLWPVARRKEILDALEAGTTVVVDRYSFSGVAFSSAKASVDFSYCIEPERGLPRPDLVLFMELDVDEASTRGGFGEERYESETFQNRVKHQFAKLFDDAYWRRINAKQSIEECEAEIKVHVDNVLAAAAFHEVQPLWPRAGER